MSTRSDPSADGPETGTNGNIDMAAIVRKPLGERLAAYTKLSGPGWLQGAITLGGGSLAGALYLGVISGYHMMWLQPLAMVLGVIMLSAIAYVTLSTGERPFHAINSHISPVLGWAWILATLMANIVWCMPQFALGTAAVEQNLLGLEKPGPTSKAMICGVLFFTAFVINFFYESGGRGIRIFEIILKCMVAVIVLSFMGVVVSLSVKGALDWGAIFKGLIPDFSMIGKPAPVFEPLVAQTGEYASYWTKTIAGGQRDKMMTAFGTAVGINMTFLLPYSMLRKSWGRDHRGLAIFDLSIGLIVPFVIATGCVLIAAASQFHGKTDDIFNPDGTVQESMVNAFNKVADGRVKAQFPEAMPEGAALQAARDALPEADRKLAAMLANRDNKNLAAALSPLTGDWVAQKVFGVGVLGMALSTIIILMLINGFTISEMAGAPDSKAAHMLGVFIAGAAGFFGPFIWGNSDARAALAVPTSVFGGSLIPIAYFTFLLLMNSRSLLGDAKPTGARAVRWNALMIFATVFATVGSVWAIKGKTFAFGAVSVPAGKIGIGVLALLFLLGSIGFFSKNNRSAGQTD